MDMSYQPFRGGCVKPLEGVRQIMFVSHVTHGAEIKVMAFGALPSHALDSLFLTRITDDVWVLHTYNIHNIHNNKD